MIDIKKLKQVARDATPDLGKNYWRDEVNEAICVYNEGHRDVSTPDEKFIATFTPALVLELLQM